MRPKFQADADFNQKVVAGLRRREPAIDFSTAAEGGIVGLADTDVLARAAAAGRILVSHDRQTMPAHFSRFIQSRSSPGLMILSQQIDIKSAIEQLLLVWEASDAEEYVDTVLFLPL